MSANPILTRSLPGPATAAAAIVGLLGASALVVAVAPTLAPHVRSLLGADLDSRHLATTPAAAARLLSHNALATVAPLAIAALQRRRRVSYARFGDVVAGMTTAVAALQVGLALGAYGVELLRYLPHLPLEFAAIAVNSGTWLDERADRRPNLPARTAWWSVLLLGAAVLETWAAPL